MFFHIPGPEFEEVPVRNSALTDPLRELCVGLSSMV